MGRCGLINQFLNRFLKSQKDNNSIYKQIVVCMFDKQESKFRI